MRLVILGGTGSGKSTQTKKICDRLQITRIATGEILQEAIALGSDLGKTAQTYIEKGELVPDKLMIQFIQQRLLQPDVSQGWILEGYPRTAFQAEELDFLLKKIKQKLNLAIYLQVSMAEMEQRALNRGLEGDNRQIIQRRLQNFQEFTIPLVEYYNYSQRLLTVNGEQSADAVERDIMSAIPSSVRYTETL